MEMFLVLYGTYFSFFIFGVVCPFPLKEECEIEKKEIVFVLDCMDSVEEQIRFVEQTEEYLRLDRQWDIVNRTYMTFGKKELVHIADELINATEKNLNTLTSYCSNVTDIDKLFNTINSLFSSDNSTLKLSFVILKRAREYRKKGNLKNDKAFEIIATLAEREKSSDRNHFFIINTSDQRMSSSHIHYVDSKRDLNFFTVYPLICDLKCTKTLFRYEDRDQKSFYHINMTSNLNHDEGNEFCFRNYNSYLLSIESYSEFAFIMSELINKRSKTMKYKVHLGLKWTTNLVVRWASRNQFLFDNSLKYIRGKACYYMIPEVINNKVKLIGQYNQTVWHFLKNVSCKSRLPASVVICECHQLKPHKKIVDTDLTNLEHSPIQLFQYDIERLVHQIYLNHRRLANNSLNGDFAPNYQRDIYLSMNYPLSSSVFLAYCRSAFNICQCINSHNEGQSIPPCTNISFIFKRNKHSRSVCYFGDKSQKVTNKRILHYNHTMYSEELVRCKNEQLSQPRCLFIRYRRCKDNYNLQNCENFTCPTNFFKCPNSFCISINLVSNGRHDCPFGEDERLFTNNRKVCYGKINYVFKDICYSELSGTIKTDLIKAGFKNISQHCKKLQCFSYKQINTSDNSSATEMIQLYTDLYNISNNFMPKIFLYAYSLVIHVIGLHVNDCSIQRFDQAFKIWEFSKLFILDLSWNEMTSSDDLHSLGDMESLVLLNISYNENLEVERDFVLPKSLEILDLSHTGITNMPENILQSLRHLRHLNLSFTKIFRFQHMGIPEYFQLDSLDLRALSFENIDKDFFKGLTIRYSLKSSDYKICCPQVLNANISGHKCEAPDDVISSCKHLVGDTLKRIVIWLVGMVTLIGNSIVLIYHLVWDRRILMKHYGLFITGLAASDCLMGIYLIIIAATDVYYSDTFVLKDSLWRNSNACYFAGFLAILSSEASTFFISLTTLDRLVMVTFPLGEVRFTGKITWALFFISWILALVLAIIPVIAPGWEIYSSNGLCLPLPLSSSQYEGWQFSVAVFVILNFLLFLLIASGQVAIFVSLRRSNRSASQFRRCGGNINSKELSVAKKLALVALSDFMCWFPIGILGMLSLRGQLFNNEVYAWVAVFVLPVNSALNPIIYTVPAVLGSGASSADGCRGRLRKCCPMTRVRRMTPLAAGQVLYSSSTDQIQIKDSTGTTEQSN